MSAPAPVSTGCVWYSELPFCPLLPAGEERARYRCIKFAATVGSCCEVKHNLGHTGDDRVSCLILGKDEVDQRVPRLGVASLIWGDLWGHARPIQSEVSALADDGEDDGSFAFECIVVGHVLLWSGCDCRCHSAGIPECGKQVGRAASAATVRLQPAAVAGLPSENAGFEHLTTNQTANVTLFTA